MNVLVYSGPGTTIDSVKHCLHSLRQILSPNYAVISVSSKTLIEEPWMDKTSALVFPGGADLYFCKEFNGEGNSIITKYVRKGGKFIGFCAGGYYASAKCQFEVGNPDMEVSGSRELSFFPGIARGAAFSGFQYATQMGARATYLKIEKTNLAVDFDYALNYYNGGAVFVDAKKYPNTEVLASYEELLSVNPGEGKAAIILTKVGKGLALLTGPHPEFSPALMKSVSNDKKYLNIAENLRENDSNRCKLLVACLEKLGLKVNKTETGVPRLSTLYFTSTSDDKIAKFMSDLQENLEFEGNILKGTNDIFRFHTEEQFNSAQVKYSEDYEDPESAIKEVQILGANLPDQKLTPYFNHHVFYGALKNFWRQSNEEVGEFGSILLYGEVLTSTSTLLDKNFNMLRYFPTGLTAFGTTQVLGRGRGGNVWVNPQGVLATSTVMKIPQEKVLTAPVIFIQYLASLAMVEAILSYGTGYDSMPIRLKWPNDIYGLKPKFIMEPNIDSSEPKYAKIGGLLVNTNFIDKNYTIVVGCGVNVSNVAPTTSLNVMLMEINKVRVNQGLPVLDPYNPEILLARYCYTLEKMFNKFCVNGFDQYLNLYYQRWLHSGQVVTIQSSNSKARITGITNDWGLLKAAEIDEFGIITGRVFTLQPDGNSFDMFEGLISRKG